MELGEICDVFGGGTPSRAEGSYWNGNIPWITAKYFSDDRRIIGCEMITEKGLKNSSSKIAPKGSTILITRVSVGKFAIADQDYAINQDLTALVIKDSSIVDDKYLWLISEDLAQKIKDNAQGVAVAGVTRDFVTCQKIPLPSLELQKKLVAEAEKEQEVINANKQLIKIMEHKISDVLSEI